MSSSSHPALNLLLRVAAVLYGSAIKLRNRHYDRPGSSRRASLPVISVGNLTVGGTGKTPMVAWLAARIAAEGHRPAVVSRGYGGSAGRGPLIVSRGEGPLCEPDHCGDEPFLLARILRHVPIVVGSDRVAAAEEAAGLGCRAVLLDDGFQHRRLARDLDILLLDASNPFGDYGVLPAGLLREPVSALRRADLVLITRCRRGENFPVIERAVRLYNPDAPILPAGHRPVGFFNAGGASIPRPRRAIAFCGIGNPSRFRIDLEGQGVEIVEFEVYRDHHPYTTEEVRALRSRAAKMHAALITTEKDLVRLPESVLAPEEPPICTLRIAADPFEPELMMRAVRRVLERGGDR